MMKPCRRCLITFIALGAGACASGPKKVDFPVGTDPQTKVNELRDRLSDDRARQFDLISPVQFAGAQESLHDAQRDIDQGKDANQALDDAGKAAARLNRVEANGTGYAAELAPVMKARRAALDAHAAETSPDALASVDGDLRDLGEDIERGGYHPDATDISRLEAKYSNLELKAVKAKALGEARKLMDRAEKRGAKDEAPRTFAEARVQYDSALRAIEADRRDPTRFHPTVDSAIKSAHKLDQVMTTIESSHVPEAAAVRIYDQQEQLAQARHLLNQERAQTQAERDELATQKEEVATLESENSKYAGQEALNRKIEAVKSEFKPDEADVFRDGDKIILRLKDMKFSTARSELTPSAIETLQKVKDMISAVPYDRVTVEGHTDDIGSEEKNLALSEARADTVEKYLVAENSVSQDKIEAKGYGFDRPLTSNKTPEGRATNRRVDVVIDTAIQ